MSSLRQQIADAIEARLKADITDVNNRVYCRRKTPLSTAELPAILFEDGDAAVSMEIMGIRNHALTVQIVACTKTSTSAEQARTMLESIAASVFSDQTFGGLACWTEMTNHAINSEHDGDLLAACQLTIVITYRTAPGGT